MSRRPTHDEIIELWTSGARVPLETVKGHPSGDVFDPEVPIRVLGKEDGWGGRLQVGDAAMMQALTDYAGCRRAEIGEIRLLNRRMLQVNSSYNIERINQGVDHNPLFMNPRDMADRCIDDGEEVEVASAAGTVRAVVQLDPSVMAGTASISHCFGDAPDNDSDDDVRTIGSAVNRLNSVKFLRDPYSGQPQMANLPVTITRVSPRSDSASGEQLA
jgi:predicted molibdopterin-dependent oxidoreductase YjgC